MKIAVDTNVLLRVFVDDDPAQSRLATETLDEAELVAIGLQTLCELVWVLDRSYGTSRGDIAEAVHRLLETDKIVTNRPAVEAGLAVLEAGGDFADGIIAFEGSRLGGDTFVTFDKKAAKILADNGQVTKLLSPQQL
jgi:predicted nucleic-acid-binding protein